MTVLNLPAYTAILAELEKAVRDWQNVFNATSVLVYLSECLCRHGRNGAEMSGDDFLTSMTTFHQRCLWHPVN